MKIYGEKSKVIYNDKKFKVYVSQVGKMVTVLPSGITKQSWELSLQLPRSD